jgi:hypothetical protein
MQSMRGAIHGGGIMCGIKRRIGSIYGCYGYAKGAGGDDSGGYAPVQPVGIGNNTDGDYEYRPRTPTDAMMGSRLSVIEVPPCLSVEQFLEIQQQGMRK